MGDSEFDLIARLLSHTAPTTPSWLRVGPGDDAAVLAVGDRQLVLSVDCATEGVHFRRGWSTPQVLGMRALNAALSDLAAMAAEPLGVLVDLACPAGDAAFAEAFFQGLVAGIESHGGSVLGGNVAASPAAFRASLTVVGSVEPGGAVLRSGARVGHEIWVTGWPGRARAGLALVEKDPLADFERELVEALLHPRALVEEARILKELGVSAMIDLSDGLAGDLRHLLSASGVGAELEVPGLPMSPALERFAAEASVSAPELVLAGGEDYELLFTAGPGRVATTSLESRRLSCIGRVTAGPGVQLVDDGGRRELTIGSFDHLR